MLEAQGGVGDHVFEEGIPPSGFDRLAVGGGDRLGRDAERELGDDEATEGVAGDVDAFPVGGGTEEDRVLGGFELVE